MTQIFVRDLLEGIWRLVFIDWSIYLHHWNAERLTLAIERVDLILLWIVKAFPGEVLVIALKYPRSLAAFYHCPGPVVVDEMVVGSACIVEQVDEQEFVVDEYASDEWIREVVDRDCVIVKAKLRVDVELFRINRLRISGGGSKGPQLEVTVVNVSNSKFVTPLILLHLLELDVLAFDPLLKGRGIGIQIVLFDVIFTIVLLGHGDRRF